MTTFKTAEEVLSQANDGKNQDIKGQFVGKHVYCNVNTLVEYCLLMSEHNSQAPFGYDNIENLYSYPEYKGKYADFEGGTEEQRQEEIDRLKELQEEVVIDVEGTAVADMDSKIEEIQEEIEELENLESEPQEVYEWWAVSSYLFDKLKEMGHPVVDAGSCYVWGRTTTGQAILLDGVISRICAEMGILQGQENDWSKQ